MKPLILILLAAACVHAQSIVDAARMERERQARLTTTKIFTSEDLKSKNSKETAEAKPVENSAPVAAKTLAPAPAPAPAPGPAVDPVQQWTEETLKLRNQVRDLMDQDTATLLEINAASAQINAPVTTQSAKNQAQKTLETAQQKLVGIRAELAKARSDLQEKDLLGPPAKK